MMLALARVAIAAGLALFVAAAVAAEIEIGQVEIEATDEGYVLNSDFELELNARLEEALHNGVSLYFLVEVEVTRPRWYWFDERSASRALRQRLWFHALTRQYRLSSGPLSQSFASLREAEAALEHVRGFKFAERGELDPTSQYDVYVRMRLDTSQLPKPFQVSAFANREWALASGWRRVRFSPANREVRS